MLCSVGCFVVSRVSRVLTAEDYSGIDRGGDFVARKNHVRVSRFHWSPEYFCPPKSDGFAYFFFAKMEGGVPNLEPF